MEILSSRHSSIHSAAKLSYKNVADIYPKQLPEVYYYYPMDDYGFSPMEKVSLRKAWVMIEPFLHRFSKEISLRFFTANELEIEKFRLSGVLQLNILHNHVLNFMKLLGRLINTIYTPAVFRSVLDENIRQLARRGIHTSHLVLMSTYIYDYLLECNVLVDHVSASFSKGLQLLLNFVAEHTSSRRNTSILLFDYVSSSTQKSTSVYKEI